jgi:outer membrane protein assembly factor BamB
VTAPVDGHDATLVFNWAGQLIAKTILDAERPGANRNGSGSNPSPATDGRNLFVYFKSGTLAGLDLDGKLLWKLNLQDRYGKDTLYWDIGTSPVLTEKDVVVAVMHNGGSYLVAYDKVTGALHWRVDRNYETPTECDHSYATPIVTRRDGREELLVWGAEHFTAHDAIDGKMLWSCGDFNPDGKKNWVVVASAVLAGDIAVVPFGRGTRLYGIKLGGSGDMTARNRAWIREGAGAFVPTPAVYHGKVYFLRDRGEIECVNPENGELVWTGALPKSGASYYSSPTVAAGNLYAAREDGAVFVAKVEPGFETLAENDMGESIIAAPVAVANRILLRGEKHLFCAGAP